MKTPPRSLAVLITVVFLLNGVLSPVAEANFWADRKKAAAGKNAPLLLASAAPQRLPDFHSLPQPLQNLEAINRESFGGRVGREPMVSALVQRVPLRNGTVRKVFASPSGRGPIVVHIQDVHQNEEAQRHIARILQSLTQPAPGAPTSGLAPSRDLAASQATGTGPRVAVVALEGAFGPIDLSRFRSFGDKNAMAQAADHLLRTHAITGPAHWALTVPENPPPLLGVDDEFHYRRELTQVSAQIASYRLELAGLAGVGTADVPPPQDPAAEILRRQIPSGTTINIPGAGAVAVSSFENIRAGDDGRRVMATVHWGGAKHGVFFEWDGQAYQPRQILWNEGAQNDFIDPVSGQPVTIPHDRSGEASGMTSDGRRFVKTMTWGSGFHSHGVVFHFVGNQYQARYVLGDVGKDKGFATPDGQTVTAIDSTFEGFIDGDGKAKVRVISEFGLGYTVTFDLPELPPVQERDRADWLEGHIDELETRRAELRESLDGQHASRAGQIWHAAVLLASAFFWFTADFQEHPVFLAVAILHGSLALGSVLLAVAYPNGFIAQTYNRRVTKGLNYYRMNAWAQAAVRSEEAVHMATQSLPFVGPIFYSASNWAIFFRALDEFVAKTLAIPLAPLTYFFLSDDRLMGTLLKAVEKPPSPQPDGQLAQIFEMIDGKPTDLELKDLNGRLLYMERVQKQIAEDPGLRTRLARTLGAEGGETAGRRLLRLFYGFLSNGGARRVLRELAAFYSTDRVRLLAVPQDQADAVAAVHSLAAGGRPGLQLRVVVETESQRQRLAQAVRGLAHVRVYTVPQAFENKERLALNPIHLALQAELSRLGKEGWHLYGPVERPLDYAGLPDDSPLRDALVSLLQGLLEAFTVESRHLEQLDDTVRLTLTAA